MSDIDFLHSAYYRYVDFTESDWNEIKARWKKVEFKKGDFLAEQGRIEDHFYVVISGVQRLYFDTPQDEHILGFSFDGSWSGGFTSFLDRKPSQFSVECLSESSFWQIHHLDYQKLFDSVPETNRWGRMILEELLHMRSVREVEMMSLNAEERYRAFLERSRFLLQVVPQKHIASYLKMTPETFSRLRKKGW